MNGFFNGTSSFSLSAINVLHQSAIDTYLPELSVAYTVVPDLYGFGTDTRAAYGGTIDPIVLHVDTLVGGTSNTDSTHGSFRWCLAQTFPRIVVFDVSGVIESATTQIRITSPYLTIAGQTAPSNIVYYGAGILVDTHDVLIQHIAVRNHPNSGLTDCLDVINENSDAYNVVIDHVSTSWGKDECMGMAYIGATYDLRDITIANSIIAEPTNNPSGGSYNYGSLNYNRGQSAHIGNLYIHSSQRNPQLGYECYLGVFNCMTYNHKGSNSRVAGQGSTEMLTYIGNRVKSGIDTDLSGHPDTTTIVTVASNGSTSAQNIIYMEDNIAYNDTPIAGYDVYDQWGVGWTQGTAVIPTNFVPASASTTEATIKLNVGSRPNSRDGDDTRLIADITNRTGRILGADVFPTLNVASYDTTVTAFVPVANPNEMYNAHYTNLENQLHLLLNSV